MVTFWTEKGMGNYKVSEDQSLTFANCGGCGHLFGAASGAAHGKGKADGLSYSVRRMTYPEETRR